MKSHRLKYVFLYGYKNMTDPKGQLHKKAKINNSTFLDQVEVDTSEFVATFQVRGSTPGIEDGSVRYYDIKNITFSTEVPPAPVVIQTSIAAA
jgi:hypothetical protein